MSFTMHKMEKDSFLAIRDDVLKGWPSGAGLKFEDAFRVHAALPQKKIFSHVLHKADREKRVLLQPRAGVALVNEHIKLLKFLEEEADLLPTTIDAYTRQNQYKEAEEGIKKSLKAGYSLLNGFPAVNHGVAECRRVVESVDRPVQIRHGTPDARLLAEITLAAGFSAFEGGGISYNLPYAKSIPLEKSIRDWQYVDRLTGFYEENGVSVNREPFGPLSGTLIPPFVSHTVGIIEGLLALEQGVKSITLAYGQAGNIVQDIAAVLSLRELAHEYFKAAGFSDYYLTIAFHQWMGGFPENESKAHSVIALGGAVAALSHASKVIVKTPHEAMGIPTKEANLEGLRSTRQIVSMLADQHFPESKELADEIAIIKAEVRDVMTAVMDLGKGVVAAAARAFEAGVLDIPFAPSIYNRGKLLPVRDNTGAIRLLDKAFVPLSKNVYAFHRERIAEREKAEGRQAGFQMVIDDIYAVSKGRLVGRPK
ncbi:MAG: methylaspartate mutase subunit E [Planctomycetales bacterium]|nr:methylaspartate mutase subunit E [Planctomycetales bacterium]